MAALLALVAQPGHGAAGISLVHRFPPRGRRHLYILNVILYMYMHIELHSYIFNIYMYNVYV